jgi:peptidyl-prolyl cis-trans isomerase C
MLLFVLSCASHDSDEPRPANSRLPAGVAAQVGNEIIDVATVAELSARRSLDPRRARDLLVTDALFAAFAREQLRDTALVSVVERAAFARALLEELERKARQRGEPTDAEITELLAARWQDLDRPQSARTAHAVVLVKEPSQDEMAREVARAIEASVAGIEDRDAFIERARSVDARGLTVQVEALPAVAADGRVVYTDEPLLARRYDRFDPDYARAANAIDQVGQNSGVVKSSFGYHVILLTERLPELRHSQSELRSLLSEDAYAKRTARLMDELFQQVRARANIEISRATGDLTGKLQGLQ